ncbi:DUF805 domain-containing protein [Tamlana sp. 2201CG12-4]|uniref:DUF805 domain-containing protein n=1 Tax=Tamlana sp. 2201CG12-4 TaxID=3112582 RepID=UPI002DC04212|nr:DUF805 domain-containing protein [Tamlana sp. 2201CG12-4]MEC3907149.1 DUF805 domain-containing protein [Tamlana sp. 2201CG12-4]
MVKEKHGVFKWYLTVLVDNYANFSGRARRQEYWMYVIFWILTVITISITLELLEDFIDNDWSSVTIGVFILATFIPWLAVNVRRLHDTGKSGSYLFINLIPIVGRIWYIVLMANSGDTGPNQYGPDPKAPIIDEIDDIGKPVNQD